MSSNPDFVIQSLAAPRHVMVAGDLDLSSAAILESRFAHDFDETGTLSIESSGITFIDSTGLRALIRISMRTGDGRLILLNPSTVLRRLLEVSGIEQGNRIHIVNGPCCDGL